MDVTELKIILETCTNDIVFDLNGKQCGITSSVDNYIPTYQCWYGEKVKEYSSVDELVRDSFFGGYSIGDLISKIAVRIL